MRQQKAASSAECPQTDAYGGATGPEIVASCRPEEASYDGPLRRLGLLIPQFPDQTHIAWWRIGQAIRELGVEVRMISTRRPRASSNRHPELDEEAGRTFFCSPQPSVRTAANLLARLPRLGPALGYLAGLKQSSIAEKAQLAPLAVVAASLAAHCRRERIEHIHVHSCANAAHLVALSRLLGGPTFSLRLGGDLEVYGKDHASKMRHACLVVPAAKPYVDRLVREVGVPAERIHWTWVGVDTRSFRPGDRPVPPPDSELRIVTVARLNPTKGHIDALQAIRQVLNRGLRARYTLVGAGPHEPEIRRKVEELKLGEIVAFRGPLSQEAIVEELQASDLFLLPSFGLGEGTPAALCEAMACGLPAVVTRIGGTTEMIRDGEEGLLVPQKDPTAIASAIIRLTEDPALARRMRAAASERAGLFDIRCIALGLLRRIDQTRPIAG